MTDDKIKILTDNRKARHSYEILDTFEAGIMLAGPEVKSLRKGGGTLKDSYAQINKAGEVFLLNCHISPYVQANIFNEEPTRPRKLLLHRHEIFKLSGKVKEKGLTLIPLKIYLKGSLIKVELGLAKGKNIHRKKETIKERDVIRDMARDIKGRY